MKLQKHDLLTPVCRCMSKVHAVLQEEDTVEASLQKLREQTIDDKIIYFYAVDCNHKLIGVVPTRQLLLSKPFIKIKDIVQNSIIRIHHKASLEEALQTFEKHRLLALPVVDDDGKLLGTVEIAHCMEESFDVSDARLRREVFQLVGLSLEEGKRSLGRDYALRMPWLFCNMVSGFICAIIANINDLVLKQFLLLAMFIPLVLTLSESVSMQAMTQSLQFLRRPKISVRYALLHMVKEWKIVWLISFSCGIIVGGVSLFWGDGLMPSLIIGSGIIISVILSAAFGIFFPIFIHKSRLDPKVASGPVVLMLADVLTTFIYLSLASYFLL